MTEIIRIIRDWFSRDHTRLVLFLGIFSAGLLGYSLGILRSISDLQSPLTMNIIPPQEKKEGVPEVAGVATEKVVTSKNGVALEKSVGSCTFIGSKNSNLYHLPTCGSAKRIKEENRVCFSSPEAAAAKGYKPGCLK